MSETTHSSLLLEDLGDVVNLVERGARDPLGVALVDIVRRWVSLLEAEEWTDLDAAGLFFTLASRLVLLKLRALLPAPSEDEPPVTQPHDASMITRLGQELARLEERQLDLAVCVLEHEAREHLTVVDETDSLAALLRAAALLLRSLHQEMPQEVVADPLDPIEARERVRALLARGPVTLRTVFGAAENLMNALSYFLALLEIIRLGWCRIRFEGEVVWIDPVPEGTVSDE